MAANGNPGRGLTISGVWIDSVALLRPHAGSVVWIAAMFIFLPQLAVDVLMPRPTVPGSADPGSLLAIALMSIVALSGQLACIAILLGGQASPPTVGAAIQRGLHLLPRALLALLMIVGCLLPVLLGFGAAAAALGATPAQLAKPSTPMSVLLLVFAGMMLTVTARLVTFNATLVGERLDAWASVRRAWSMTTGAGWVLAGFILTLALALLSTTGLLQMVGDVVASLLFGKAIIGKLIVATLVAAASTTFSLLSLSASVVAYRALAK